MTGNNAEERDTIRDEILESLERFGRKHMSHRKDEATRIWKHIYSELNEGIRGNHFAKRVNRFKKDMVSPFFELEFVPGKRVLVKTIRKYATHLKHVPIEKETVSEIIEELNSVLYYYHLEIVESVTRTHVHQPEKTYRIVYKKGVIL